MRLIEQQLADPARPQAKHHFGVNLELSLGSSVGDFIFWHSNGTLDLANVGAAPSPGALLCLFQRGNGGTWSSTDVRSVPLGVKDAQNDLTWLPARGPWRPASLAVLTDPVADAFPLHTINTLFSDDQIAGPAPTDTSFSYASDDATFEHPNPADNWPRSGLNRFLSSHSYARAAGAELRRTLPLPLSVPSGLRAVQATGALRLSVSCRIVSPKRAAGIQVIGSDALDPVDDELRVGDRFVHTVVPVEPGVTEVSVRLLVGPSSEAHAVAFSAVHFSFHHRQAVSVPGVSDNAITTVVR